MQRFFFLVLLSKRTAQIFATLRLWISIIHSKSTLTILLSTILGQIPQKLNTSNGIDVVNDFPAEKYDAVILGVAHKQFLELDVRQFVEENGVIYDVKGVLPRDIIDGRL